MNVELTLNFLQLLVAAGSTIYVGRIFLKTQKKQCFLGLGFLLSLALGILYWFSYQMLMGETPQYFYISDIAWVTSYLFLGSLELYICTEEEKRYQHILNYLPFLIGGGLILYFCQWGDILFNILYIVPLSLCMYWATRNLLYGVHKKETSRYKKIHVFIIFFAFTEYALWISSCFWISDTITNPYFWFDLAITLEVASFAYLMKEVSGHD